MLIKVPRNTHFYGINYQQIFFFFFFFFLSCSQYNTYASYKFDTVYYLQHLHYLQYNTYKYLQYDTYTSYNTIFVLLTVKNIFF